MPEVILLKKTRHTRCDTCLSFNRCHRWFKLKTEANDCEFYEFNKDRCPFSKKDEDGAFLCTGKEATESRLSYCTEFIYPNCPILENNLLTRKLADALKGKQIKNIGVYGKPASDTRQILLFTNDDILLQIKTFSPDNDSTLEIFLHEGEKEYNLSLETYDEIRKILGEEDD